MEYFINTFILVSITAAIILIAKKLLKNKISPKWQFILWGILAIRLLVPVFPESDLSIFNTMPMIINVEAENPKTTDMEHTIAKPNLYVKGKIILGEKAKDFTVRKNFADNIGIIWCIGFIILSIYMTAVYFIYNKRIKKLSVAEDSEILSILNECKEISEVYSKILVRKGGVTPHLKGLFSPEIIIPEGYTSEELKSIFIHELMHYKHKDILWNIIGTFLLCIHWYNPIIWVSYFIFRKDMEILCDYNVLRIYDNRKRYASVLLKTSLNENKMIPAITSMHNRKKDIDKRIKYIACFKRPKFIWTGIGVVVAIIIGVVCLTNPTGKSDKSYNIDGVGHGKSLPMENTDSLLKETVDDSEIGKLLQTVMPSSNENIENDQFTIDQLTSAVLENDIQQANEIIKNKSVDINEADSEGKYPIEMVLVMNNCDMAKILLEAEADPYVTTSNGKSVYDIVMESGSKYLKEIFMEYGEH